LEPNYGWYWWRTVFAPGWVAHTANGWKGQRISIFLDQEVVVSMTALAENDTENGLYSTVIKRFVIPAVTTPMPALSILPETEARLRSAVEEVGRGTTRIPPNAEFRMVPSSVAKETHRLFP